MSFIRNCFKKTLKIGNTKISIFFKQQQSQLPESLLRETFSGESPKPAGGTTNGS